MLLKDAYNPRQGIPCKNRQTASANLPEDIRHHNLWQYPRRRTSFPRRLRRITCEVLNRERGMMLGTLARALGPTRTVPPVEIAVTNRYDSVAEAESLLAGAAR